MAFIVPFVAAIGSAIGSVGSAVGSALGIGSAAAAGTTAAAGAATTTAGLLGTGVTLGQALSFGSTALGLVGTGVSAMAQLNSGQNQAAAYRLAATNALIEGNQRALEYKRQGNQVLARTIETDALIRAKAGAGNIDPFSGSAGALSDYAFMKGVDEYSLAQENARFSVLQSASNASSYRMAASSALTAGQQSAAGTGLYGAQRFASSGIVSSWLEKPATKLNPYSAGVYSAGGGAAP